MRLGPRRRSTGAAPSRERAARAITRRRSMPGMAWSGSTSRRLFVDAGLILCYIACLAWLVAGERLLDVDGRARPRPRQPAVRLPRRHGQLAHRLVSGQEGLVLERLRDLRDAQPRDSHCRAGAAPTSTPAAKFKAEPPEVPEELWQAPRR